MKPISRVAVVGRPNVGKSTLFNRLVGRRVAIVDKIPGVTRDRIYGKVEWNGRQFGLIDTAGIMTEIEERFEHEVQLQVEVAIGESDLVLFVVDAVQGPTAEEEDLVRLLRRTGKPVVLAVNKSDVRARMPLAEFHRWGLENVIEVSAQRGTGTGDLLDMIVDGLPDDAPHEEPLPGDAVRIAVIGRPNVGKSSLVNRLIGEDRMVVSAVAGTTRDPVDTLIRFHGRELVIVDTAGLRRKMKTARGLDYYTMLRTISAIERSDVAIVMLDSREGLARQDLRIIDLVLEAGKGMILAMNKWDLVEDKQTNTAAGLEKDIRLDYPHLSFPPVVFISAVSGQRLGRLLELAVEVFEERNVRLPAEQLDDFIRRAVENFHPPHVGGRQLRIHGCKQVGTAPPAFRVRTNMPGKVPEHYKRYLVNRLRELHPFTGNPVRLFFSSGERRGKQGRRRG